MGVGFPPKLRDPYLLTRIIIVGKCAAVKIIEVCGNGIAGGGYIRIALRNINLLPQPIQWISTRVLPISPREKNFFARRIKTARKNVFSFYSHAQTTPPINAIATTQ